MNEAFYEVMGGDPIVGTEAEHQHLERSGEYLQEFVGGLDELYNIVVQGDAEEWSEYGSDSESVEASVDGYEADEADGYEADEADGYEADVANGYEAKGANTASTMSLKLHGGFDIKNETMPDKNESQESTIDQTGDFSIKDFCS